ncbi:MAG: RIP metalloprotease RseP, partial [Clostridiales bacterium]|nr:RIP metalloprotease RseP [Clostridiales bacterium]
LMFGILIAVHEFGHFAAAKLLGVKVNEFSIGMGPQLFSRQGEETCYSLRALPIGGFCAMEGEDEETDDPRAFTRQAEWKRFLILVAGSFMNFLVGLLLLVLIFAQRSTFITPVIADFMEGFAYVGEDGLLPGDRIVSIDGERVYIYEDVGLLFSRSNGENMDLVVERDGANVVLDGFPLRLREYELDGETQLKYGLYFTEVAATPGMRLRQSFWNAVDFVRVVRMSLGDLVSGAAGLKDLSGPIGIVGAIVDVGEQSESVDAAMLNVGYFSALVAVNLAVMNLLPLPALDGGRIFFLLVGGVYTLFTRRKINPKYEGYVHMAGLLCLLGLMVVVAFNDIIKLIG